MKFLVPIALLAACGESRGDNQGAASENQIERLSTPKPEKQDPTETARLQPVTPEDLDREGLLGAGCDFSSNGQTLLAAVGSDAIVRVQGELRHLVHSAPVGPTGGFFEDRQLSVSVGRTSEAATTADETSSWSARITVTNRRTEVQQVMTGLWTCGA
jgi:hypothetical protein